MSMWDQYSSNKWRVGNNEYEPNTGERDSTCDLPWVALSPHNEHGEEFLTHTEAIEYAHREATKALARKHQLPPHIRSQR